MTRAVTERAKALARDFEKFRDKAYLPTPDDVWTLGYGHTLGVKEGDVCTRRQADVWLTLDFHRAAAALERKIGKAVVDQLTDNQHDALCDFVLNLGTGDPAKKEWTIWGLLRRKAFSQIPAELSRFVYQGKKKLNGLVRRRNAEIELWSDGEPGSSHEETTSAVTRFAETPPAPVEPVKPIAQSKTFWTGGVVAAGGVVEGARQVQALVAPQAEAAPLLSHLAQFVAVLIVAGGIAIMVFKYFDNRSRRS